MIVINGNGNSIVLTSTTFSRPVMVLDAPNSIIENNVYTQGSNIVLVSSENSIIRNNTVENANSYAIIIEYSAGTSIYNNMVKSGKADGIIAYQNDNILIQNNTIIDVVKNGIYTVGNNMSIIDNIIDTVAGTGIYMVNCPNSFVQHNTLSQIDWKPIAPDSTTFSTSDFENNTIDGTPLTSEEINPDYVPRSSTTDSMNSDSMSSNTPPSSNNNNDSSKSEMDYNLNLAVLGLILVLFTTKYHRHKFS